MTQNNEFSGLAEALLPATLEAARLIMTYFGTELDVTRKGDDSPVTEADRLAEEIITRALRQVAPGITVVGEEMASGGELANPPASGGDLFLIDPIDGTRGFIKGRREFTINIGLIRNGAPVFGIIYAPALNDYYATFGPGHAIRAALRPDMDIRRFADLETTRLQTRALDTDNLVAVSSKYVAKRLTARLERLQATRLDANSSIKFCIVARGDADLYPRYGAISEWDTAAGAALLTAAGGCTTGLDGALSRYGKSDVGYRNDAFIAWSTPEPTATLLDALRDENS